MICSKCKLDKPENAFHFKDKSIGLRKTQCRECIKPYRKIYYQGYYNEYKTELIEEVKERKKIIQNWLKDYKSSLNCIKCGENHISCLQFHHRDSDTKDMAIAQAVNQGWSKERILEEIKKCDVLCANCHFKEHYNAGIV